ncbi:hypothetical protein [Streptomyces sp. H27-C3]|uniref:hypothetical protein n=1 Tax=Streptomyces sp. H27-C3 TaxID=3046305 RepID=UPI0024BB5385|nr:hypothetical protein [Streptomyces sp. H27-C3]MDJ0466964.1 hypothetical protein [Streptomyces sp. H27-C3]
MHRFGATAESTARQVCPWPCLRILPAPALPGGAYLGPLDRTGRTIDEHWICLHVESWSYSASGTGRIDLTLDISCDDFRTAWARKAHELWSAGPPTEPNL